LLVDAYHAVNVVPFSIPQQGLEEAFVVGGGYKYCQLGEGNCFLRLPLNSALRPAITGWFAEFGELTHEPKPDRVSYAKGGDQFASGTYDPTANYRAVRVFDFFADQGLTPQVLREVSQHQVGLLAREFDAGDADPAIISRDRSVPLEKLGGFLALRAPGAGGLWRKLRERGVFTDYRGDVLRLGPAPYLSDEQLRQAMATLRSIVCSGK
jgi:kynureninase